MAEFILEIQLEISDRAGAFKLGQMGPNMKDSGYMIGAQASEGWNRAMGVCIRVFGKEIELMVKESTFMRVELFMKVIG